MGLRFQMSKKNPTKIRHCYFSIRAPSLTGGLPRGSIQASQLKLPSSPTLWPQVFPPFPPLPPRITLSHLEWWGSGHCPLPRAVRRLWCGPRLHLLQCHRFHEAGREHQFCTGTANMAQQIRRLQASQLPAKCCWSTTAPNPSRDEFSAAPSLGH